jgi:hypothetical protein
MKASVDESTKLSILLEHSEGKIKILEDQLQFIKD